MTQGKRKYNRQWKNPNKGATPMTPTRQPAEPIEERELTSEELDEQQEREEEEAWYEPESDY